MVKHLRQLMFVNARVGNPLRRKVEVFNQDRPSGDQLKSVSGGEKTEKIGENQVVSSGLVATC